MIYRPLAVAIFQRGGAWLLGQFQPKDPENMRIMSRL